MHAIIVFLKNWTLPAAMAFGVLAYSIFAFVPALGGAADFFAPVFDEILPWFLFVILFITFCKVDFAKMKMHRWHLLVSAFQLLFVVMLMSCILGFEMTGKDLILMEGVLTCIIGPCASAAPVVTAKLGGNLESMTTYTFFSNFITAIMVPLCFPMIEQKVVMTFFQSFLLILTRVFVILIVPMFLAYVVKHFLPRVQHMILSINDLPFYLWGCSLAIVTGTTVKNIANSGSSAGFILTIAAASFMLCLVQFSVGRYIGYFFGATVESGQALGQKNTAFAIWVAYTYLNPLSSVGPGCYILWQNAINSLELWQQRHKEDKNMVR